MDHLKILTVHWYISSITGVQYCDTCHASRDHDRLAEDGGASQKRGPDVRPHAGAVAVAGVVTHVDLRSELSLLVFDTVHWTLELNIFENTADKYFPIYTCDTRLQAVLTHFLMNI